jgi:large subunit ribosomal protein L10
MEQVIEKEMEKEIKNKVSEKKKQLLKEVVDMINKHNTIMIALIENLSSAQFQKLKKLLSDKAKIKVVKKTLVLRALEKAKTRKEGIDVLEKNLLGNFAMIFSNIGPFELAAILSENKTMAPAKPGYIAKEDLVVKAGPTDLPAGPVISELSKAKIKASIESGKIVIRETSIVAKAGEPISIAVANVLAKLEVNPLIISLQPVAAYDSKVKKVYENIKVDKEEFIKQIKKASACAFNFALNLEYFSKETIEFLLIKAISHFNALKSKISEEEVAEKPKEKEEINKKNVHQNQKENLEEKKNKQ